MKKVTYHTACNRDNFVDTIPPTEEAWAWIQANGGDVHVFEDTFMPQHASYDGKVKVACVLEAPAIYDCVCANNPSVFHPFRWLEKNHQHFNIIMSPFLFVRDMVGADRYWWVPVAGTRIKPENYGMYEKERLFSIVASHKQWTEGHRLRHQIVNRYPGKIDTYGSGYNNIINEYEGTKLGKILAIAPYCFSFAVMNSVADDYFSEILIDVLACGTVPIWWGTKNIGNYFNPNGFVTFNTIEELDALMPTLTMEKYQSMIPAVTDNVEKAKAYRSHFDWIYTNYKDKLEAL